MRAFLLASLAALLVCAGCDEVPPGEDGGPAEDGGRDAGRRDAGPPPMCTPECAAGDTCCDITDGTACFNLRDDPTHCGACNVNCIGSNRGDACSAMQCQCGDSPLGCQGTFESFCCPARRPGGVPYCANLAQSAADCGACGDGCDPAQADHCDGGQCICGDEREACLGTPESTCCADSLVDVSCFDTTTDRFHCGACGNLCQGLERCENGACTRGAACDGGCAPGQVCCDGACCSRSACLAGTCVPLPDGGPPDAGPPDAGPPDAGAVDAGSDAGGGDGGA